MAITIETASLVINALAYGLIPIGLWWIIIHYRSLRVALFGIFVHMAVVSLRAALLVGPIHLNIDWSNVHLFTAVLAGGCLTAGVIQIWKEDRK